MQVNPFFACFGPLAKPSWCLEQAWAEGDGECRQPLFKSCSRHKKRRPFWSSLWCPEQDLNLHSFRNTHLKRARLPIPPPGHLVEFQLLELLVKKNNIEVVYFCAQDKTWTCTALRRLPPQSSVSTNSTTWANGVAFSVESGCKSTNFFRHSKIKIHLFWTKIPNILKYKADNTPFFFETESRLWRKNWKNKKLFWEKWRLFLTRFFVFLKLKKMKGISIYQELENWRICKFHILNLIRIRGFYCKQ